MRWIFYIALFAAHPAFAQEEEGGGGAYVAEFGIKGNHFSVTSDSENEVQGSGSATFILLDGNYNFNWHGMSAGLFMGQDSQGEAISILSLGLQLKLQWQGLFGSLGYGQIKRQDSGGPVEAYGGMVTMLNFGYQFPIAASRFWGDLGISYRFVEYTSADSLQLGRPAKNTEFLPLAGLGMRL